MTWRAERLASMTLTSGSTGLPKAAVHLCRPPCQRKGVLALMPYGESDDWLLSLPLFHVSGQGFCGAGYRAEAVSPYAKTAA